MAQLLILSLAGALSVPDNWRPVFPLTRRTGSHFFDNRQPDELPYRVDVGLRIELDDRLGALT
jgi:hypothetical protein